MFLLRFEKIKNRKKIFAKCGVRTHAPRGNQNLSLAP